VTLSQRWQIYGSSGFLRRALGEGHVPKVIQGSRHHLITDENTAESSRRSWVRPTSWGSRRPGGDRRHEPESIRTTRIMSFLYGSLSSKGSTGGDDELLHGPDLHRGARQHDAAFEVLTSASKARRQTNRLRERGRSNGARKRPFSSVDVVGLREPHGTVHRLPGS